MKKLSVMGLFIVGIIFISGCIDQENGNSKTSANSIQDISKEMSATSFRSISLPSNNYTCEELLSLIEYTNLIMRNTSFLPGDLPGDLPVMVPIPDDAVVIGSAVYSDETYQRITIFLDILEDHSQIIEFYQNNLKKTGWNETEGFHWDEKGFASSSISKTALFCRNEEKDFSLRIISYPSVGEDPTEVILILETDIENLICNLPSEETTHAESIMPLLKLPEGARIRGAGEGGGEDYYSSDITLKTDLSVIELENYYKNQLREVRWEETMNVSTSSIAFSTWSFTEETGENWSGILSINEVGQDMRFAYFSVQLIY